MTKKSIKTSIKEKRRQRKSKGAITSNDDLYSSKGGAIFDELPTEDKLKEIETKVVKRKRLRPLVDDTYRYKEMAKQYSAQNNAQQLGNYRQAMEFLAHITLSNNIENRARQDFLLMGILH